MKNREGRTFPFTMELRALLEAQRERVRGIERARERVIPHVWVWNDGRPVRDFRAAWTAACTAAGCPGRLLHDCRRTSVRALERAGVPRSVAMKLTGHKTEAVYRRYAIVAEGDLTDAARRLDNLAGTFAGAVGAKLGEDATGGVREAVDFLLRRDGGTGRRCGLKIPLRDDPRGGSNPPPGSEVARGLPSFGDAALSIAASTMLEPGRHALAARCGRPRRPHARPRRGPALRRRDQPVHPRPGDGLARPRPRRVARGRRPRRGRRRPGQHLPVEARRRARRSASPAGSTGPNQVPVVAAAAASGSSSTPGTATRCASAAPGFGGIGSDVWVMRRDGSPAHQPHAEPRVPRQLPRLLVAQRQVHRLDRAQLGPDDAAATASPTSASRASIRTGRRAAAHRTSTWCARATATGTRRSGGRPTARASSTPRPTTTAVNPELFFCRLRDPARDDCQPVRLTTNPAWDEQAIFTPDMSRIIFMSSRDLPGRAQRLGASWRSCSACRPTSTTC